jgi:glutaredoxin 3
MSREAKIKIYSSEHCPYCTAARMLLKKKGLGYEDLLITQDPARRAEMERLTGRRKVPQIFIDDRPIGGFDELYTLEQSGELDRILAGSIAAPAD